MAGHSYCCRRSRLALRSSPRKRGPSARLMTSQEPGARLRGHERKAQRSDGYGAYWLEQVPVRVLQRDHIDRLERIAVRSERDRAFERREVLHLAQRVLDRGALGRKLGRVARHLRLLHRLGVEQHDVVGGGVELRRGAAVEAGRFRAFGEFGLERLGAIVEVGIERGRDGGAIAGLAHLLAELGVGDGRTRDQAALVPLPAQFLGQPHRRFRTGADADEIGRLTDELRDLRRHVEGLGLERDAELHVGAGLFHDAGQHHLAHDLGDHVVGGVGDRPGGDREVLLLERAHHALEHVAFVRGVAECILERLGELGRGRSHRHGGHAGAIAGREHHAAFAGTERPDHRDHLVVFGKLAQADHGLIGLAGGIERDDAQLLAGDAAGIVDLVDRDLRRDLVGLGEGRVGARRRRQIAEQDVLRGGAAGGQRAERCGEADTLQRRYHGVSPIKSSDCPIPRCVVA